MYGVVSSLKGLDCKLLHVGFGGYIVDDRIIARCFNLCLLELVHQSHCVVHALLVGLKALAQYLFDDIVIACMLVSSI